VRQSLLLAAFVGLQLSVQASAAIPSMQTQKALQLPESERLDEVRTQGAQGYRNLREIMFDEKQEMAVRWRALMTATRIAGRESKPELERAMKSREWFMRNAGLIAYSKIDRTSAVKWARKLLTDKALVVRTAAVEALMDMRDTASSQILWSKLYAPENFHNKKSLFIRRRIVEALISFKTPGAEAKFVMLLGDRDEELHSLAIAALENMTRNKLGQPQDTLATRRELWQKWWQAQGNASKANQSSL
jgi:HEAT repeat protein